MACWSNRFGVAGADGGKGGSSLLLVMDEEYFEEPEEPDPKPWRVEEEAVETSEGAVPLFSQVNGGPETWMGFERPIVEGRPAWRTVPKSHKSSGSPFKGLGMRQR